MKNFVFTSAGDNTTFYNRWCSDNQTFDLYIIYYGNNDDNFNLYKSKSKLIERREGSKFQNFYYFYKKYPEIIDQYDKFFILDDDIQMTCDDINKMFELSHKYNFDICQPSLSEEGVVCYNITRHVPGVLYRTTNFVEVNTPLFSKNALINLMNVYHPDLIGWGIDFLYIWANGLDKKNNYAVIHCVKCINPNRTYQTRELYKIKNVLTRRQTWEAYANTINCPIKYSAIYYTSVDL